MLACHSEQRGAREVDLCNLGVGGQGDIAHRGEIVEVRVTVTRFLHGQMSLIQLLVLHLQFDLVHLQFVEQGIGGPARQQGRRGLGQLSFGARAQRVGSCFLHRRSIPACRAF